MRCHQLNVMLKSSIFWGITLCNPLKETQVLHKLYTVVCIYALNMYALIFDDNHLQNNILVEETVCKRYINFSSH
jgi:hypothetical protein